MKPLSITALLLASLPTLWHAGAIDLQIIPRHSATVRVGHYEAQCFTQGINCYRQDGRATGLTLIGRVRFPNHERTTP